MNTSSLAIHVRLSCIYSADSESCARVIWYWQHLSYWWWETAKRQDKLKSWKRNRRQLKVVEILAFTTERLSRWSTTGPEEDVHRLGPRKWYWLDPVRSPIPNPAPDRHARETQSQRQFQSQVHRIPGRAQARCHGSPRVQAESWQANLRFCRQEPMARLAPSGRTSWG